jgi:ubiquitin-conjugating enzyme E2 Q
VSLRPCSQVSIWVSIFVDLATYTETDVSEYPSGHMYHIFSADDDAPSSVGVILDHLPNTEGKDLLSLLEIVSKAFAPDSDGDIAMVDSQFDDEDEDEEEDEGFSDGEYGEDDFFGGDASDSQRLAQPSLEEGTRPVQSSDFRERIRSDLKTAKAHGFKIGHQGPLMDGAPAYVSVSCRIIKLGISEEAMQAWELEPSQYLILLIHYPSGYKSVDWIRGSDSSAARRGIEYRVGISSRYKPTLQEAINAFTKLSSEEESNAELLQAKDDATAKTLHTEGFRNAFISRPLNELLNERLATIIRYRYIGMCWTGAEEFYNDNQGKTFTATGEDSIDNKYMAEEPVNQVLPSIVTKDHLIESKTTDPHSFPLLAMQFLLRHFVRCTEFCLVCHCKLEDDLEALKPYVCDKPLCLYQYMSLGFGPSIEHEIISQPYVVDLLISFCYQSAIGGKLNSFPTGLSLNVPPPKVNNEFVSMQTPQYPVPVTAAVPSTPAVTPGPQDLDSFKAKFDRQTREILFEKGISNPVRVGDWICYNDPYVAGFIQHARVVETHLFPTIRITEPVTANHTGIDITGGLAKTPTSTRFQEFSFFVYNTNFDSLNDNQKRGAIVGQLDLLPNVIEIKEYLTRNRMATLSSWTDRISPTASGILRWIIASNRACIVQVDNPDQPEKNRDSRLHGMDGWMQFRFAMGAPDKERRFMNSVQSTTDRLKLKFPTVFAWHGSPLQNWHSIIREGLHFKEVSHGRAFGNGCYHSMDFNTSFGYSGMHYRGSASAAGWPSSMLKMSCAMALNEIVNAPNEYVSNTPHLVVAQLDWIQTRYLFVQCNGDLKPTDTFTNETMHIQDPNMTPTGQKGKILIPLSAMPKSRRGGAPAPIRRAKKKMRGSGSASDPIPIDLEDDDSASVDTDIEDINILVDDDISFVAPPVPSKTQNSNGKHGGFLSSFKALVSSSKSSKPAKLMTDFVPGSLDYSSLPLMGQPSWSTTAATRRLQKDFQALLKVQESQPLHELGWYMDPEQFSNVYQWIVEFHSFEEHLPLAKQMKEKGIKSVVMEMRFGPDYPMSPPFVRVIRPRFLSFLQGGGGHVTAGGAICMEVIDITILCLYHHTNPGGSFSQTVDGVPSLPSNLSFFKCVSLCPAQILVQPDSSMVAAMITVLVKPLKLTSAPAKCTVGQSHLDSVRWPWEAGLPALHIHEQFFFLHISYNSKLEQYLLILLPSAFGIGNRHQYKAGDKAYMHKKMNQVFSPLVGIGYTEAFVFRIPMILHLRQTPFDHVLSLYILMHSGRCWENDSTTLSSFRMTWIMTDERDRSASRLSIIE